MKNKLSEKHRITHGFYASPKGQRSGAFAFNINDTYFVVVMDDGQKTGWEHVSVSTDSRCPTWEEMCHIKNKFWEETETVVQFHPKKSDYKNVHPFCLHLWKKKGEDMELPPEILVAP